MSTLNWARQVVSGTTAASPFQTNVMMAIIPNNASVLRTIVTFDWWVDSNTTEFIDVGADISYGVSWGTSSTAPDYHPHTDAGATGNPTPWLYWDQMGVVPIEIFDVSGTVYYLSKNTDGSRHIDTRAQRKNSSGASRYLWFGVQANGSKTTHWSDTYWAVSSQILYETP